MSNNPTLKWWLIQSATVVAVLYCLYLGLFHQLWEVDISKISFIILALYAGVTTTIGVMLRRMETNFLFHHRFVEDYTPVMDKLGKEMEALGLVGTIVGFLVMLGPSFASIDLTNTVVTQKVIAKLAVGMSTALTTTLVGLICAMLTRVQLTLVEHVYNAQAEDNRLEQ